MIYIEQLKRLLFEKYGNEYPDHAIIELTEDFNNFILIEEFDDIRYNSYGYENSEFCKIFKDTIAGKYIKFRGIRQSRYGEEWYPPIEVIPKEVIKIEYEEVNNRE